MKRFHFLFTFILFFTVAAEAQTPADTTPVILQDTVPIIPDSQPVIDTMPVYREIDSFSVMPVSDTGWKLSPYTDTSIHKMSQAILAHHPYFGFQAKLQYQKPDIKRVVQGKDLLFYGLIFLFLVYALLKTAFPKYFNDLYRLFFRTTLKQRQISEQLIQTPLPSLLLNGFFVLSASLYACFLLRHYGLDPTGNFWLLFLYCCAGLSAIYFVKFIGLKISGWVFNMAEAADSYIFIVFIINKMLGILLLPFLVLLAFTTGDIYTASFTLSLVLVLGLVGYRFILTYAIVRNQVSVNPFHFFIYLCAFEIAPLLLIYKALLVFFTKPA